ncbi:hypothetical protein ONA70_00240 [Micromonospora yasonensis]|uniref:hypothetical protein n=1 Tax=Micromonospora yasonensis TaxID=1128667 RepID=UPI002230ABDE|nr:hypothetical protein [Micromonospora yasonensis]MCW3838530.1 hypothetical protein [Micromonospora yasonensis]
MTASTDPYLLRLLLHCWRCDLRLVPVNTTEFDEEQQTHAPKRNYKCGLGCHKQLIDAAAIESKTWTAAERRATVTDVQLAYRQSVLEMLLAKVVIGPTEADVTYTWRM